jgi:hypothetical protein
MDLKMGTMNTIQLKKTVVERIPYPYSECMTKSGLESYSQSYQEENKMQYKQADCLNFCLQSILSERCKCYSTRLQNKNSAIKPCLTKDEIACSEDFINKFYNNPSECSSQCPYDCYSVNFDYYNSMSDFPSRNYFPYLINHEVVRKFAEYENITNVSYEFFRERMLGFNVYFNDLVYTKLSEIEKFEFIDLLANIG